MIFLAPLPLLAVAEVAAELPAKIQGLGAPESLSLHGWIALLTTGAVFLGMQLKRRSPVDVLFLGGLVLVTLTGVLSPEEALKGFASKAVIMIGALFATSAGLRNTGALDWLGSGLLDNVKTERGALRRLAAAVLPSSAFVLNTPLVAMLAPVVVDWCRRRSVSPSRLLIPLSYLSILGGVCTLIGTSTTLVINGELAGLGLADYPEWAQERIGELRFFEMTSVGLPLALIGAGYILFIAPRLLPDRSDLVERFGERRREYLVEMTVLANCPLIGKSVQEAGLRNLPGLFLIEIDRTEETITPVTPRDRILADDRLVFTGVVNTIADLERIPGLVPAADEGFESKPADRVHRQLTEVVLSRTSPIIGMTVREGDFRKRYNAAVVAVHRNGERLTNKIGTIRLEPGDTLLLQTRTEFVDDHRNSRDFYLVSRVDGTTARRHDRAVLAMLLFLGLILWLTVSSLFPETIPFGNFTQRNIHAIAAVAIVLAMVLTRCMTTSEARSSIDLQVLLTIGAAIGLGKALHHSGAAAWLADRVVGGVEGAGVPLAWQPYLLLAIIYVVSQLFTETITNVAVASIMISVAIKVAIAANCDPRPFIIAVTMAASLSFATPIGYQTNLMVMGPGGYQPRDYLKVGLPLALLTSISALLLISWLWPLARV
ncbi:SLC13 family permease [Adhaeretor mobilis]|uniref:Potassium transporter peripheral membrane component n=1 Tax=Adhaeretor mobilis TaxID=1930276 RepID=A0A517MT03_9BACT|nr:SLC13 family permease [Adhaeretor mobilis]QDS97972.1 potassium transporter peripheral membrane component [Adhaeretor mobilis]